MLEPTSSAASTMFGPAFFFRSGLTSLASGSSHVQTSHRTHYFMAKVSNAIGQISPDDTLRSGLLIKTRFINEFSA